MSTYRCVSLHGARARLYVCGTTHWHPASAVQTLRLLELLEPQLVLVEVPERLEDIIAQGMRELFPSSLGFAVTVRSGNSAEALVFSATDSITTAIRWCIRRDVRWHGIDLAERENQRSRENIGPTPDPWWELDCPDEYQSALAAVLRSASVHPGDAIREAQMAAVIRDLSAGCSGPVVIVLGASHVDRVVELLQNRSTNLERRPAANVAAQLAHLAGAAFVSQYLGPLPRLAQHLVDPTFRVDGVGAADFRTIVQSFVHDAVLDYEKVWSRRPAIDAIERFWRVVHKRLTGSGDCLPTALELIRAAGSVVDQDFALMVARRCLGDWHLATTNDRFPVLEIPGDGIHDGQRLQDRSGAYWVHGGGRDPASAAEQSAWAQKLHAAFGPKPHRLFEPEDLPRRRYSSFTTPGTRALWLSAVERIRRLVRSSKGHRAVRWTGGRLGRLDVHEMIHAACVGRRGIYHERPIEAPPPDRDERDDFFPTVWVFEDDPSRRCYPTYYFLRRSPQQIYCARPVMLRADRSIGDIRYVAAIACLVPWHFVCPERKRFLPLWIQSGGYTVPMRDPWSMDTGQEPKRPYEHLALVALQCARRQVVIVSDTGTRMTPLLRRAAQMQKKHLLEVRLSAFSPDEVESLRSMRFEPKWIEDEV